MGGRKKTWTFSGWAGIAGSGVAQERKFRAPGPQASTHPLGTTIIRCTARQPRRAGRAGGSWRRGYVREDGNERESGDRRSGRRRGVARSGQGRDRPGDRGRARGVLALARGHCPGSRTEEPCAARSAGPPPGAGRRLARGAQGTAHRTGRVPGLSGIHRLLGAGGRRLPDRHRERGRRDRADRRPPARRPGGQRPLRAQRRQRPLGQPLRCAVRHRRGSSRGRRPRIRLTGRRNRPGACAARDRMDERFSRRDGSARAGLPRRRHRLHATRARRRR